MDISEYFKGTLSLWGKLVKRHKHGQHDKHWKDILCLNTQGIKLHTVKSLKKLKKNENWRMITLENGFYSCRIRQALMYNFFVYELFFVCSGINKLKDLK